MPLRLPWVLQFVVLIKWNKVCLFGCLGLFNLLCLLVVACCSVGLAAMGWATGWAIGWAIGLCHMIGLWVGLRVGLGGSPAEGRGQAI